MKSDAIIEKIRSKLTESDPQHRTVVNIFQFHFTDADGKLIKSVELNIYEGTTSGAGAGAEAEAKADAEVTVADEDFYKVGRRELDFAELLEKNRAQVQGDCDAVNRMMEKFRLSTSKREQSS